MRELGDRPAYILLGVCLGVGAVLAHSVGRLTGQPLALAALAAAQLGFRWLRPLWAPRTTCSRRANHRR